MPIHDWTRVDPGIFHDFHQGRTVRLSQELNSLLSCDHYAMLEQNGEPLIDGRIGPRRLYFGAGKNDLDFYTRKKNIVTVRHVSGDRVVAVIEIISPGNKAGRRAFAALIEKTRYLIARGIHVLLVDLFPPTTRDPNGLHAAVWEEFDNTPQSFDPARPLTAVSYEALGGGDVEGYIEPLAVGDRLPDMPVFLRIDGCVMAPLDATYSAAWAAVPPRWQRVVEPTPS